MNPNPTPYPEVNKLLLRLLASTKAILTMCRVLHTLEHGTIVSKPVAARWAQAKLGGK